MNFLNALSLRSRFLITPLIGIVLTLILYFSSNNIINSHLDVFKQLSGSNLPQVSRISRISILFVKNQSKLSTLLLSSKKELDEEKIYLEGRSILNDLHALEEQLNQMINIDKVKTIAKKDIYVKISLEFSNYIDSVINAIELSTVDTRLAHRELNNSGVELQKLNDTFLMLSDYYVNSLIKQTNLIEGSLQNDKFITVLTIVLILLMVFISLYLANRLSSDIKNYENSLKDSKNLLEQEVHVRTSEYKQAMEVSVRFGRLLDNSSNEIFTFNADNFYFTHINKGGRDNLGYSIEELYKMKAYEITPKINRDEFLSIIEPLISGNSEQINFETIHKRKNGEIYPVEVQLQLSSSEKPPVFIAIILDVTERHIKNEQLRRTLKMDALGKLIGGIAHDYNNMMGIVLGYSELLLAQVVNNQKAIDYVVNIRSGAERARKLTNKLMTFSQSNPSEKTVVSINQELENQVDLLEKTLTSRIELNLDLEDNLWAVHFDSGDFTDAIINMIINASHAIEETGTVNISTNNVHLNKEEARRVELTEGDYVRVLFSDSGKGMDDETVSKIFDPFFTTKGEQGTGLGMSQVYGFVKRSSGTIKVNSELNLGAEFVLYFPRYYDSNSKQDILEIINNNVTQPSHETILVVDDEETLCNMTKEILANQGYHVLLAFSGAKALEILKTERVDIVFSDVIMPEMTGYELAEKISDRYPDILIQLTSGYTGDEKLNHQDGSSTFDILDKPYTSTELLNKLTTILGK